MLLLTYQGEARRTRNGIGGGGLAPPEKLDRVDKGGRERNKRKMWWPASVQHLHTHAWEQAQVEPEDRQSGYTGRQGMDEQEGGCSETRSVHDEEGQCAHARWELPGLMTTCVCVPRELTRERPHEHVRTAANAHRASPVSTNAGTHAAPTSVCTRSGAHETAHTVCVRLNAHARGQ
eukprot:3928974-Pleurochrysis_carterae.AAC.1